MFHLRQEMKFPLFSWLFREVNPNLPYWRKSIIPFAWKIKSRLRKCHNDQDNGLCYLSKEKLTLIVVELVIKDWLISCFLRTDSFFNSQGNNDDDGGGVSKGWRERERAQKVKYFYTSLLTWIQCPESTIGRSNWLLKAILWPPPMWHDTRLLYLHLYRIIWNEISRIRTFAQDSVHERTSALAILLWLWRNIWQEAT